MAVALCAFTSRRGAAPDASHPPLGHVPEARVCRSHHSGTESGGRPPTGAKAGAAPVQGSLPSDLVDSEQQKGRGLFQLRNRELRC